MNLCRFYYLMTTLAHPSFLIMVYDSDIVHFSARFTRNLGIYYWYSRSSMSLSVCMPVRMRNSKTIATIDLICLHKKCYTRGSVLLDRDPDMESRIYTGMAN